MVWEHEYYPQFYVKQQELRNCVMKEKEKVDKDGKAMAAVVELTILAHDGVEEAKTDRAVYFSEHESLGPLAGMVRLEFGSMGKSFARRRASFLILLSFSSMANVKKGWN